jgi:hypothetical protein
MEVSEAHTGGLWAHPEQPCVAQLWPGFTCVTTGLVEPLRMENAPLAGGRESAFGHGVSRREHDHRRHHLHAGERAGSLPRRGSLTWLALDGSGALGSHNDGARHVGAAFLLPPPPPFPRHSAASAVAQLGLSYGDFATPAPVKKNWRVGHRADAGTGGGGGVLPPNCDPCRAQNTGSATVEPAGLAPPVPGGGGGGSSRPGDNARWVLEARGFNVSSSGIGLVQTVMIVPDSGVPPLLIGACDATRQYQGESNCLAEGF